MTDVSSPDVTTTSDTPAAAAPSWDAGFSAESAAFVKERGFASPGAVVDAYREAEARNAGRVYVPGADATAEERAAFYAATGRPADAAGYDVGKPADWPSDIPFDPQLETAFRSVSYEAGLSADQAKAVSAAYNRYIIEATKQMAADRAAQFSKVDADLTRTLGVDGRKELEGFAEKAVTQFGGGEMKEWIAANFGPAWINFFGSIGKALSGVKFAPGTGAGGPSTVLTAAAAVYNPDGSTRR